MGLASEERPLPLRRQTAVPGRIVCLTAESTEIVFRLGAGDRIVGVSGFALFPSEARRKPRVGGYTGIRAERVLALRPDLVLAYSDLQADVTHDLIRAGATVLHLNQRSVAQILDAILLIGRLIGEPEAAERLCLQMAAELEDRPTGIRRPRVYFEEWDQPLICGIGWVSDLIEAAGGTDIFRERAESSRAEERRVNPTEVVERDPEIVFASWCGKRVSAERIRSRPGWDQITGIQENRVVEIRAPHILQPGPSILHGFRQMRETIRAYRETTISRV